MSQTVQRDGLNQKIVVVTDKAKHGHVEQLERVRSAALCGWKSLIIQWSIHRLFADNNAKNEESADSFSKNNKQANKNSSVFLQSDEASSDRTSFFLIV